MERDLIYRHEKSLGTITLVLGILFWLAITICTIGIALIYVLIFFLVYLFSQSAFISHIKGTAVKLSPEQFPDLYQRYIDCCLKLEIETPPEAYLLHGDGLFNAYATRFLGRNFVVLLSDLVDTMDQNPEGVNFYIGHELGHIRMKHLTGNIWRLPCLWLPLLGAAYSRAQESTCDLHGLACCASEENAARAMAALAAGHQRWATLNLQDYVAQTAKKPGFWMSYHELCGTYPWLNKRIARIQGKQASLARRNGFAYLLALFTPNVGRVGGAAGPFIFIAIIGILAAIALPAYQQYTVKAKLTAAYLAAQPATVAVASYYETNDAIPESLESLGISATLPGGNSIELDAETMVLHVTRAEGGFNLVPTVTDDKKINWQCAADETTKANLLPTNCR